jgi:hypothetical protein
MISTCSSNPAEFRQMHDLTRRDLRGCEDDARAANVADADLTG